MSSYRSQTNNKSCSKKRSLSTNAERILDAPISEIISILI